ncbi:autotransporter outer membrane beta-barrel domain-containing protein [Bosea sp. CS1GBMeth4]|uniref:autotransporter family protein n=1 Tax=Bosea sp. CS1GBMeth4 TaxID=1892849 RepID=UPI0016471A42|nr:autotransporter outer membrane beta-barrel domain-containing protein [Bosea sp. CS1GBMeth4]
MSEQFLFAANNATFTTSGTYGVNITGLGGGLPALSIWGHGAKSYSDTNATVIDTTGTVDPTNGLYIVVGNDLPGSPASLTFRSNGNYFTSGDGVSFSGMGGQPESGRLDAVFTGKIDAGGIGLIAFTPGQGATITVNDVHGRSVAIRATIGSTSSTEARVLQDLTINTNGLVRGDPDAFGTESYGINVLVTNGAASGLAPGVKTNINVASTSIVEGDRAAISVLASNFPGQTLETDQNPIIINNYGVIRNNSQKSDALAILGTDVRFEINNINSLIGTVSLGKYNDIITNTGIWNTANGSSDFGAGNDVVQNNGTVLAATNAGVAEMTTLSQLETFSNNASGTIRMNDGAAGDVLTTGGNYISNGGRLLVDTFLGTDASPSDRLVIRGDSLLGSAATWLLVANTTGRGAQTTSDGIKVVQVDGASASGAFVLGNRVAAGAYEYLLYHNGVGANAGDGDWYLRSTLIPTTTTSNSTETAQPESSPLPNYRVEVPVDMAVPALANRFGLAMLGTYHDRAGEDYADPITAPPAKPIWCKDPAKGYRCTPTAQQNGYYADAATGEGERRKAAWARIFGETGEVGYGSKGMISRYNSFEKHGPSYDFGVAGAQIGLDLYRRLNDNGTRDIAGLYIGAGRVDSEVKAVYGGKAGSTTMNGYSLGAYWTRKGASGWYVDAVVQGTWYDRIRGSSVLGETLKTNGWGFTASLEAGYPVALGQGWALEPQAQLIYQRVSIDDGADSYGLVRYDDTNAVYGRLGARLTKAWTREDGRLVTVWGRANLWHAFGADAKTTFTSLSGTNPVALNTELGGTWAQFGLGVSGQISRTTSVFASGDYNLALGNANGHSIAGRLGLKVVW